ncbi:MAG: hypothetical protein K1X63_10170 [Chitinophagales bacterium]|nr:hypothetical protein [Chitinophagales bacterium]
MKIELSTYHAILFGGLRPWLQPNRSLELFKQKLTNDFRFEHGNIRTYEKARAAALKEYELLSNDEEVILEIDETKTSGNVSALPVVSALINLHGTPHYNFKTEFYYFLIQNEGTRFIHYLSNAVEGYATENLAVFLVNTTLDKIKFYLAETNRAIKANAFDENLPFDLDTRPETKAERKDRDFILRFLHITLIRLYLEIQHLFPQYLQAPAKSENDLMLQYVGDDITKSKLKQDYTKLNDLIIKRFIQEGKYSKDKALQLIDKSKERLNYFAATPAVHSEMSSVKHIFLQNILALENLIFIHEFALADENTTYETLISDKYADEIFTAATTNMLDNIESENLPTKRLEIISAEENRLAFINTKLEIMISGYLTSLPRKVLAWLSSQRDYVNANMHIDFSKLRKADLPTIPTSLTVAELGYLLRTFVDEKIFTPKHKTDVVKVFSALFSSKKKDEITFDGLHKEFKTPANKAVKFWFDKFSNLSQKAYADQEKFLN